MDLQSGVVRQNVFLVASRLVRLNKGNDVVLDDIVIEQLKDKVVSELDAANKNLRRNLSLKRAQMYLQSALESVHSRNIEATRKSFESCYESCIDPYNSSEQFSCKATATHLKIISIILALNVTWKVFVFIVKILSIVY